MLFTSCQLALRRLACRYGATIFFQAVQATPRDCQASRRRLCCPIDDQHRKALDTCAKRVSEIALASWHGDSSLDSLPLHQANAFGHEAAAEHFDRTGPYVQADSQSRSRATLGVLARPSSTEGVSCRDPLRAPGGPSNLRRGCVSRAADSACSATTTSRVGHVGWSPWPGQCVGGECEVGTQWMVFAPPQTKSVCQSVPSDSVVVQ